MSNLEWAGWFGLGSIVWWFCASFAGELFGGMGLVSWFALSFIAMILIGRYL